MSSRFPAAMAQSGLVPNGRTELAARDGAWIVRLLLDPSAFTWRIVHSDTCPPSACFPTILAATAIHPLALIPSSLP